MYVNLAYDTDFIIIEIIRIFKQKKKKKTDWLKLISVLLAMRSFAFKIVFYFDADAEKMLSRQNCPTENIP